MVSASVSGTIHKQKSSADQRGFFSNCRTASTKKFFLKRCIYVKLKYILRRPQNLKKKSHLVLMLLSKCPNKVGDFFQILRPYQKTSTLNQKFFIHYYVYYLARKIYILILNFQGMITRLWYGISNKCQDQLKTLYWPTMLPRVKLTRFNGALLSQIGLQFATTRISKY